MHAYGEAFYARHAEGSTRSASRIVPLLASLFRPASVLDVGCGDGSWLLEWARHDITDFRGVDGPSASRALRIPSDRFLAHDLERPLELGRKFDLVTSLEVAEHLDARFAPAFIESLVRHGELVVFSAAVPGQFGEHHVNEQWPSYWASLFARAGFKPFDVLRPRIWADPEIEWWYRQNILVFCTPERAAQFPALMGPPAPMPLEVAHPDFVAHFEDSLRTDASIRLVARKLLRMVRARLSAALRPRKG